MSYVDIGFSGGTTIVDKVIQGVSGAFEENVTHAFTLINGRPYEALGIKVEDELYPQARFRDKHRYDGVTGIKYIRVDIPDIDAFVDMAYKLDGTPYGYTDCVSVAIKILTGKDMLEDGIKTVMCAELIARLLIAGGLGICSDLKPDQIAPVVLYRELLNKFNGVDVTSEYTN